jgi:two-component system cell cycle sensor histidine kinase/response regulator CckA
MTIPLRILIVDDSAVDVELTMLQLSRDGLAPDWKRVETADEMRVALAEGSWDIVLSDFSLPCFGANEALTMCRKTDPDLPFIVVSGMIGEHRAVDMMRAGAGDYLLKSNLTRLSAAVEREVREAEGRRARKRAEIALRKSETRYRRLFEAAQDGILIVDAVSRQILDANPFLTELLGYRRDELVGKELWEIGLFLDIAANKAAFRTLQEQGYIRYEDLPLVTKDGRQIQVEFVSNTYGDGDVQVVQCNIRDITERKRSEEAVRQSRKRLRNLIDGLGPNMFVALLTPEGILIDVNQPPLEAAGLKPEDVLGRPFEETHWWTHSSAVQSQLRAAIVRCARGEPSRYDVRTQGADGQVIDIDFSLQPLRDEDGNVTFLIPSAAVITDRKRAEEALRVSEDRFRAVVESDMLATFFWNEAGDITDANDAFLELVGYSQAELRDGKVSWANMTPPEGHDRDREALAEIARTGRCTPYEKVYIRRDGSRVPVLIGAAGVNGRDSGVAFALDQTARKRTEERLARNSLILANVRDSVIVTDADGIVNYWNEGAFRLFGWTSEEMLGRSVLERVPECGRADLTARIQSVCMEGEFQGELEDYRKDGSRIWIENRIGLIHDLSGRISGLLKVSRDISARKEAEADLRMRDRAIMAATQGILITDSNRPDNPIIYVSPAFERITGYNSGEARGRNCRFLQGKETDPAAVTRLREAIQAGEPCNAELLNYRKDGTAFWNELFISPVRDPDGRLTHFVGVLVDVTARRSIEEQFRQAQKMDAFGQLAGGVAHDFNNLLTIINGYSELLLEILPESDPSRQMIAEIHKAGERSAGLTRQLLAFSRQQILATRILNLNDVVADIDKMLKRLIGEDIRLTTMLETHPWAVKADPGQVEQVLLNLAVNARDAMPKGGRLTIETKNVELDESYVGSHKYARAGRHVRLSVTDTGSGIPPELMAKIFEPFFTTKEPGKGTGLGLATVYGIVKQSGGHVAVYSEVGLGTTFKVYLPQAEQPSERSLTPSRILAHPRGTETILLAEDEAAVRALTRKILTGCGYQVLEAIDGDDAARVAAGHGEPIHLLITDVIMPGTGGRAVAEQLTKQYPMMQVIYVSGYTDDAVIRHGVLREGVNFIQKPFTPAALARKVRDVLDGTKSTGEGP